MKVQSTQHLSPQFGIANGKVAFKPVLGGADILVDPKTVSAVRQSALSPFEFASQLGIVLRIPDKLHTEMTKALSKVTAILLKDGRTQYVLGAEDAVKNALA